MTDSFGTISELGRRYLDGQLRQQRLQGDFSLSHREDVTRCADFTADEHQRYVSIALNQLRSGTVAFAVLAAGASSRMHLSDIPPEVAELVRATGARELPTSKALVPVVQSSEGVLNYLDLFLINVRRFSEATSSTGRAVIFVSESNQGEIRDHLEKVRYRGLDPQRIILVVQPLAPQIVAKKDDIEKARKNFAADEWNQILAISEQYAGHDLMQRKPGGHGEFLHQLIARGAASALLQDGVRYIFVRNIDNTAALIDDNWLAGFGYMLASDAHLLLEVAQRPLGQKGGALIRQQERWRVAEDPSFVGTRHEAAESYYINCAVATFRLDYLYPIYETSADELLSFADQPENLAQIADRGRRKFPTLMDAKPVRLADGRTVAAVTPETNMWESTGIDERLKVLPLAVDSDRDAGEDLAALPPDEQRQRSLCVRFSPTKSWSDYGDANKQCIAGHVAERIVNGALMDARYLDEQR